jgi:TfoX/Sxy family transcriptional regulator of competence genes
MFGVLCLMVNGKMCICVGKDELMCRVDPSKSEKALQKAHTRPMYQRGRYIRNCIFVKAQAIETSKEFNYWIRLSIDFNRITQETDQAK